MKSTAGVVPTECAIPTTVPNAFATKVLDSTPPRKPASSTAGAVTQIRFASLPVSAPACKAANTASVLTVNANASQVTKEELVMSTQEEGRTPWWE